MQLPRYAYIPGQTARHPDDAFDAIRKTAVHGQGVDQLARCEAFRAGLYYFDQGYFWEAHEVLEPVWLALPEDSVERQFVQGLIQLANGRLKLRMGRLKAALRLVGQARGLLLARETEQAGVSKVPLTLMTLNVQDVHRWIDELESEIILAL